MRPQAISLSAIILLAGSVAACSSTPAAYTKTNGGAEVQAEKGKTYAYTFDQTAGKAAMPDDFGHVLGNWTVEPYLSAPSQANVLWQLGRYGDPDFPRVVLKDLTFTNSRVRVRCLMQDGSIDRACGLMTRFQDSDNYYVVRANTLEDSVNLYKVVAGSRLQLAGRGVQVVAGQWQTLEVVTDGDVLKVLYNREEMFEHTDATFAKGRVGLWTKADSITAFDDFEATEN